MAICGIQVRMEKDLGYGHVIMNDDTALNGAKFMCCPFYDSTGSTIKINNNVTGAFDVSNSNIPYHASNFNYKD